MMEGYEGGGDAPEEELLGLFEAPLGNNSAGAMRPLCLSDRGPVLDAGSVQVLSTQKARLQLRSQPQVRSQGPSTRQACTGH